MSKEIVKFVEFSLWISSGVIPTRYILFKLKLCLAFQLAYSYIQCTDVSWTASSYDADGVKLGVLESEEEKKEKKKRRRRRRRGKIEEINKFPTRSSWICVGGDPYQGMMILSVWG
uniref:Uncharacterized protein n=1 Tax=Solanum tuberosum TaxID=4113 RepID=M1DK59_SOLTU